MVKDHNTEQLIFEAARKVFMQKGLAGARMQEIADEAGINKSLLHYYFRSKEKLFDGIFNDVVSKIAFRLGEAFEKDMDVMQRIRVIVDSYIDILYENQYLPMFVLNEMNHNPEKFSDVFAKNIFVHMRKFVIQIFVEIQQGKIRPINPIHLLLNILSLVIFPFAALPVMKITSAAATHEGLIPQFDISELLQERKTVVYDFIESALIIKK
jgi:TetR/AcrR family transcriptional regulator